MGDRKKLIVILAVGLILRLGYGLYLADRGLAFPDEFRYDRIAGELVAGKGFTSSFTSPGYPSFLAIIYGMEFQRHPHPSPLPLREREGEGVTGHSFLAVRLIQTLLSAGLIWLVYLAGKGLFNEKAGLIAAFLAVFDPIAVFFTGLLLSETLYTFVLFSAVYFWARLNVTAKQRFFWLTSVLFGIAILIKPLTLYLLVFCLALTCFKKKAIIPGLCILLVSLAVQTPWVLHNWRLWDKFILTTTGGGITLYESNNPEADGGPGYEKITWTDEMKKMNEPELDGYFRKEAKKFIRSNPATFFQLAGKKFLRFWSPVPNANEFRKPVYLWISLIFYAPVFILGCIGMLRGIKGWKTNVLFYLPLVFFTLAHMVFLGSVRYRVPVMPFFLLFVGFAVQRFFFQTPGVETKIKDKE